MNLLKIFINKNKIKKFAFNLNNKFIKIIQNCMHLEG